MHRACPQRTRCDCDRVRGLRAEIAIRVGHELGLAADAAEMIIVPVMNRVVRGRGRINGHPAHGIGEQLWLVILTMLIAMRTAAAMPRMRRFFGMGHRLLLYRRCVRWGLTSLQGQVRKSVGLGKRVLG